MMKIVVLVIWAFAVFGIIQSIHSLYSHYLPAKIENTENLPKAIKDFCNSVTMKESK
jgi:hypothetical protein